MHDKILAKLEQRIGRRGFLQGSGLAVTALVGVSLGVPGTSWAQDVQQQKEPQGDKKPDDQRDANSQRDEPKDEKDDQKKPDDNAENDPYKKPYVDASGREYRLCPVCGSNMYRQERTWTCENCGYSYEE